jgi:nuclear pore complex protein Nup133
MSSLLSYDDSAADFIYIETVLQNALEYRDYNLAVYGIELPIIQPWSSTPAIIESVYELFSATTRFVEYSDEDLSGNSEPASQLPHLAGTLFACMQERLDWLGRCEFLC